MLVLSRKEKQTILVGDDIVITICRVSGRRVTIGLRAPSDVNIRRGEVLKHDPSWPEPEHDLISHLARVRQGATSVATPVTASPVTSTQELTIE